MLARVWQNHNPLYTVGENANYYNTIEISIGITQKVKGRTAI
jgi:hypothetical protein